MIGLFVVGAAILASVLCAYIVAAAECGAWPFHRLPNLSLARLNKARERT